ncbi:MAG: hypothetical protein EBR82_17435 [Caulobacteraceae bacterium]|nr:hypothetical protein [Caulobacteraceae bacterium]
MPFKTSAIFSFLAWVAFVLAIYLDYRGVKDGVFFCYAASLMGYYAHHIIWCWEHAGTDQENLEKTWPDTPEIPWGDDAPNYYDRG